MSRDFARIYYVLYDLTYLGELSNIKNMYRVNKDDSEFPCYWKYSKSNVTLVGMSKKCADKFHFFLIWTLFLALDVLIYSPFMYELD